MPTIWHAIAGYWILVLTVRILTRRPGAQMTPFEFVIVFLMGGVIILATEGPDLSEINSICGVITVALMHRLVSFLKVRFPKFGEIIDGTPLVILKDGQWQTAVMEQMRLHDDDVMAAARTKGVRSLPEIKYAVLERNGAISIIKREK